MVENHVGDDTDDLSVTLMEVWAGGQCARHPFHPNLFFTTPPFLLSHLTYNYDFLTGGDRAGINFV